VVSPYVILYILPVVSPTSGVCHGGVCHTVYTSCGVTTDTTSVVCHVSMTYSTCRVCGDALHCHTVCTCCVSHVIYQYLLWCLREVGLRTKCHVCASACYCVHVCVTVHLLCVMCLHLPLTLLSDFIVSNKSPSRPSLVCVQTHCVPVMSLRLYCLTLLPLTPVMSLHV